MKWRILLISMLSLTMGLPALAQSKRGRGEIFHFGLDKAPGVRTIARHFSEVSSVGKGTDGRSSSPTEGVLVPVALVPHTCAPRYGSGGVPLSYSFSDTTGDCATFAAPEPVTQRPGRPRRARPPSSEEIARTLADRAVSLAPEPELEVAPSGTGLTGLESYFWLGTPPAPIEATAQAGPVTVTAEARPVQFVWEFGDGRDLVTTTPGRPWRPSRAGTVAHLYEARGRYELTVEVVWEARWRIGAGPWQLLGHFSTSDSRPYPVRQVVAVLTRPR